MNIQGIAASPGLAVGLTRRVDKAASGLRMESSPRESSPEVDAVSLGLVLQHLQRRIESLIRNHSETAKGYETQRISSLHELWNDLWPQEWLTTACCDEVGDGLPRVGDSVESARIDELPPLSSRRAVVPPCSTTLECEGISAHSVADVGSTAGGFIAVARSMTAAELQQTCREGAVGAILGRCSWHSDTMLLARSLGIPLVCGLRTEVGLITDNMPVVVDGTRGVVHSPASLIATHPQPMVPDVPSSQPEPPEAVSAVTRDGITIQLLLTLELRESPKPLFLSVADGIGLWRCDRAHWHKAPLTTSEFLRIYRRAADSLLGQAMQIALCHCGQSSRKAPDWEGDRSGPAPKPDPVFEGQHTTSLEPREWTGPQLQALSQLAKDHPVTLLLPGIDCCADLQSTISALFALINGDDRETLPFRIGVLVETPSAALAARGWLPFAQSVTVDWDSLARNMSGLEDWQIPVDPVTICLSPPVLRLLHALAELSRESGIPLTLCAHRLGNPLLMAVALALGIRRISVSPSSFRSSQQTISQVSVRGLGELRHLVCSQDSAMEITHWLRVNMVR